MITLIQSSQSSFNDQKFYEQNINTFPHVIISDYKDGFKVTLVSLLKDSDIVVHKILGFCFTLDGAKEFAQIVDEIQSN